MITFWNPKVETQVEISNLMVTTFLQDLDVIPLVGESGIVRVAELEEICEDLCDVEMREEIARGKSPESVVLINRGIALTRMEKKAWYMIQFLREVKEAGEYEVYYG